ncbi:MAG: class I SAM-dependent methyltransferase [Propionivibrio sp.]|uniref:class I SAM-dependent methyltransferase n=1 Tax=Propionivibrio sp. TaxID=2212460 RepID=UPI0025D17733|nr:class I SAM-dependent methyltransferase [Propionivibrio sp.]MBK8895007.1 class I SAM-dependent methyltransferase [Propionivibrio sp.]
MVDNSKEVESNSAWDHSSNQNFVDYYAEQSISATTIERFTLVRDRALSLLADARGVESARVFDVADIGCATGTQARLWAELGHRVHAIDVNSALIEIGRLRANNERLEIEFDVGSATELPYPDSSMDVALLPELLEHVADWQGCLNEAIRILKPGGLLYLSTTNFLCPVQNEFNLPLYSWYPAILKRHYERLAVTTQPEIANFCKYPAVNWFSFYSLAAYLKKHGFRCLDRFDMVDEKMLGAPGKLAIALIRALPPLRFMGQLLTQGSVVFALRK